MICREDDAKRHREKMVINRPRRKAWNRSFSHGTQKELILFTLISGFWSPEF